MKMSFDVRKQTGRQDRGCCNVDPSSFENKEKMQKGKIDVWKHMSRMSEKRKPSTRKC